MLETRQDAEQGISRNIEDFYNPDRRSFAPASQARSSLRR
jgi:hypothetical protein